MQDTPTTVQQPDNTQAVGQEEGISNSSHSRSHLQDTPTVQQPDNIQAVGHEERISNSSHSHSQNPTTNPPRPDNKQAGKLALADLKKLLSSSAGTRMKPQHRRRHEAVRSFLSLQHSEKKTPLFQETRRKVLAGWAARCHGGGQRFAREIIKWEKSWIATRSIPESQRGGLRSATTFF